MVIEHSDFQGYYSYEFQYWVDGEQLSPGTSWWLESTSTTKGKVFIGLLFSIIVIVAITLLYMYLKKDDKDEKKADVATFSKNKVLNEIQVLN